MSNLIQIQSCKGIDCTIKTVQSQMYAHLMIVWGQPNWNCFPRIYKNKKTKVGEGVYFVPEFMQGNFEYTTDTLFDDRVDVVSYFLLGDEIDYVQNRPRAKVSIIFSCLINNLYTRAQKPDEEMGDDILNWIKTLPSTWKLEKRLTGVDNVYSEFKRIGLDYSDLGNRHLVRFDFEVSNFIC
jgi:hypothetical protein